MSKTCSGIAVLAVAAALPAGGQDLLLNPDLDPTPSDAPLSLHQVDVETDTLRLERAASSVRIRF